MHVLLADDHDLFLETVGAYLEARADITVETCGTLDDACARLEAGTRYDLVLLDFSMPGMRGLDGLTRALACSGGIPVGIMSGTATRDTANSAIAAGAVGFLPKTMAAKSLVNAIRFMAMGETYVPLDFLNGTGPGTEGDLAASLSERERQVLQGLCRGASNKEIARDLDLQEVTVKLHVKTLCRKLGATNRTQAALIGREAGLA
jgi:DNA-binding NarL/FixJ family response regulator